jgi:site-specific DNA recombinase
MSSLEGKRFIAVVRVSRRAGRGEDEEYWSRDRQEDAITAMAEREGFAVVEWVDESDSVSGGSVDREGLMYAVGKSERGEADGIVVAKLNRYARTLFGGLTVINRLEAVKKDPKANHKPCLVTAKEGVIVGEGRTSSTDKAMRNMYLTFAELQRDMMSEEWDSIRESSILRGIHPREVYGYRRGDDRRLVPFEPEASHVKMMFNARAEGKTYEAIADALNDAGIKPRERVTAKGKTHDKLGRKMTADGWTAQRVREIIRARVYKGIAHSGDPTKNPDTAYELADAHPAIVGPALWDKANHLRKAPARRGATDYMLSGIVRCEGCGYTMPGAAQLSNGVEYRQYKCRRVLKGGMRCPAPANVNASEVEALAEAWMDATWLKPGTAVEPVQSDALDEATSIVEDILSERRNYLASPVLAEMRRDEPEEYDAGLRALNERLAVAREAETQARNAVLRVDHPTDLAAQWASLSADGKRGYLANVIDSITVRRVPRGTGTPERVKLYPRDSAPDKFRVGIRYGRKVA